MEENIDFDKAYASIERALSLSIDKNAKKNIAEFLYGKCHYFTAFSSEYLNAKNITLFYLKNSNQIIHSAVTVNEYMVLDVLGVRLRSEIQANYDAVNYITGILNKSGYCLSKDIPIFDFDPDIFYTKPLEDSNKTRKKVVSWLKKNKFVEMMEK